MCPLNCLLTGMFKGHYNWEFLCEWRPIPSTQRTGPASSIEWDAECARPAPVWIRLQLALQQGCRDINTWRPQRKS